MTTPDPTVRAPTDAELLSERLDHESALNGLTAADEDLVGRWRRLGTEIRSIPVQSADIADAVAGEIGAKIDRLPAAAPDRSFVSRRRSTAALIAASVTVLSCCVALWFVSPLVSESQALLNVSSTFSSRELANGFAKCDIVVVTMPESQEPTSEWLQASFDAHGMRSHVVRVDSDVSLSDDSRLVGSDAGSQDLLSVLNLYENEFNPHQIDEMDPGELLSRFVESLETPSLAEEHFDELIVVLPKDLLQELRADHAAEVALASGSAAVDVSPTVTSGDSSASVSANSRPVLFVIRRKKASVAPEMDGVQLESPPLPWHIAS